MCLWAVSETAVEYITAPLFAEEIEGLASYPHPGTYPTPTPAHFNGGLRMPIRKSPQPKVLQLPVDEDNYLAPHSTSSPAMYTDLSDKGESQ